MRSLRHALVAIALCSFVLVGCSSPKAAESSTVDPTAANSNGFTDAKQDDCEMGFQPACEWLAESH